MKEASIAKYYFAKYFLLAFGLLQWVISAIFLVKQGETIKGQYGAFVFFTLGLILVSLHSLFATRMRRVAISKKKVLVTVSGKVKSYDWDEIKSIRFIPVFNMYAMKIKGKKNQIYFLPTQESEVIYGLFPSVVGITKKDK
jgi:hypothetical protein